MRRVRVLLADNFLMTLDGLTKLLEADYDVVDKVTDGNALFASAAENVPDVVILDMSIRSLNPFEAVRRLRKLLPKVHTVLLSPTEEPELIREAMQAGVSAFLPKTSPGGELLKALSEVLGGQKYITPKVTTVILNTMESPPEKISAVYRLTGRQREVLQLVAQGKTMKEAATIMGVTPRTVAFHKYRVMEILRAKTSADLVQFAVKHNIVA